MGFKDEPLLGRRVVGAVNRSGAGSAREGECTRTSQDVQALHRIAPNHPTARPRPECQSVATVLGTGACVTFMRCSGGVPQRTKPNPVNVAPLTNRCLPPARAKVEVKQPDGRVWSEPSGVQRLESWKADGSAQTREVDRLQDN